MKKVLMFLLVTSISTLCFIGQPSKSDEDSDKFEVFVIVKCEKDPVIEEFVRAFIKIEFGHMQDAIITPNISDSTTHILEMTVINKVDGVTIASVFCENVNPYLLLLPYLSEKKLESLVTDSVFPRYYNHRVQTFLEHYLDVEDACRDIVAKFDVLVLDDIRLGKRLKRKREQAREGAHEIKRSKTKKEGKVSNE